MGIGNDHAGPIARPDTPQERIGRLTLTRSAYAGIS
jgi:hypothetical protein